MANTFNFVKPYRPIKLPDDLFYINHDGEGKMIAVCIGGLSRFDENGQYRSSQDYACYLGDLMREVDNNNQHLPVELYCEGDPIHCSDNAVSVNLTSIDSSPEYATYLGNLMDEANENNLHLPVDLSGIDGDTSVPAVLNGVINVADEQFTSSGLSVNIQAVRNTTIDVPTGTATEVKITK